MEWGSADNFRTNSAKSENSFDIKQVLYRYVYHWPLYVLVTIIMIVTAFVYNKYQKPIYYASAKLSIKNSDNKTKEEIALRQVDETDDVKGVETELAILTSKPLIRNVVDDLQLWVTYEYEGKYIEHDLYGQSPITFIQIKPVEPLAEGSFEIIIESKDKFAIVGKDSKLFQFNFINSLSSSLGIWRLNTSSNLSQFIGKKIKITIQNPEITTEIYANKINAVNFDKTSPIIDLSIEDNVSRRGVDVLNELIAEYHKESAIKKRNAAKHALDFIDSRLASLTGEVNGAEKNVQDYKSDRAITDLSEDSRSLANNLQNNEKSIGDIDVQLKLITGIQDYINTESSANPPSVQSLGDPELSRLVEKLTDEQVQRNKLLASVPEKNPVFIPINKEIKSLKDLLRSNIADLKSTLITKKTALQKNSSNYLSTIKSVPKQERELVGFTRQQEIKQDLYKYLLQKRDEIGLNYASTLPSASIIESASSIEKKSRNNIVMSVAIILGLLVPTGLIFGRDKLSSNVLTKNELENQINVPIISEIMFDEDSTLNSILNKPRYVIGEQFRDLRTKLNSQFDKNKKGRVVLFTSSVPAEGKSFLISNLGVTLAASNKKTIILELDLRLPKITKRINLNNKQAGISEYLNDQSSLTAIIQKTKIHPYLDIIGSGTIPDNPTELLESEKMSSLINSLKEFYDYILIDTPPVHLVTDAKIIAYLCDITLYAVRHTFTPKNQLDFINEIYAQEALPNMLIVFNGVQRAGRYKYGYEYNHSYYLKPKSGLKSSFKNFFQRF